MPTRKFQMTQMAHICDSRHVSRRWCLSKPLFSLHSQPTSHWLRVIFGLGDANQEALGGENIPKTCVFSWVMDIDSWSQETLSSSQFSGLHGNHHWCPRGFFSSVWIFCFTAAGNYKEGLTFSTSTSGKEQVVQAKGNKLKCLQGPGR